MSTALAERPDASPGNGSGALVVRPQATIGAQAEMQRVQAEIQSRLMVAKSCPRDEVEAMDRIKTACQRVGLAENAEYSYSRGGTEINGPTIDLLRVIANCWGNIDYGFRELSQANKESTVEAYAWELETNAKNTKVFTIPHKRYTRQGSYDLTDPRDIYETVANNAERRVRACLEAIIPPDVVAEAVSECRNTLKANADVSPDAIKKLVTAFGAIGVTAEQIETRLGRRLDSMQPAQLIGLRRIYKSLQDGMSKPADWFEQKPSDQPATSLDAAKDVLRKKATPSEPETHDRPQTSEGINEHLVTLARTEIAEAADEPAIDFCVHELLNGRSENEATVAAIRGLAEQRKAELQKPAKGKK
jgi:hypothetical protein